VYTLKKSLGQHFLKDQSVIDRIISALHQHSFHQLLEVGPGAGALTKSLLQLKGIDFKAVELDKEKVDYLSVKYPLLKDKIISASFLEIEKPFTGPFTVIGNFPYNISTQILFKILDWKDDVPVIIGMFQKEVAQRAASAPGSKVYGVLSALVQAYYNVEYLFDVAPECFNPPPKVMSGVVRFTKRINPLNVKSERLYWVLVKTAFNQRRKTLRNALKAQFSTETLQDEIFNKRAEELSIDDYASLTFKMKI
jgi:16S rRNA (adenine1518-N6/adenine1519-N6)-dimethyltransferase